MALGGLVGAEDGTDGGQRAEEGHGETDDADTVDQGLTIERFVEKLFHDASPYVGGWNDEDRDSLVVCLLGYMVS